MPVILKCDDRFFPYFVKWASELLGFACVSFKANMTMQLATQNAGKIYSQKAMLTQLCYLTHKHRRSGARLPSNWKEDATWSFIERNWVIRNLQQTQSANQEADFYVACMVKLNISYSTGLSCIFPFINHKYLRMTKYSIHRKPLPVFITVRSLPGEKYCRQFEYF